MDAQEASSHLGMQGSTTPSMTTNDSSSHQFQSTLLLVFALCFVPGGKIDIYLDAVILSPGLIDRMNSVEQSSFRLLRALAISRTRTQ